MHLTSLVALTGLTLAAAAPAALTERAAQVSQGNWTLQSFVRSCNDTANTCDYSFTVLDNNTSIATPCNATDTGDASRQARFSSPSNLACAPNSPFYFNVGYDQPGNFFVVVPVNTGANLDAFFGYTAAELVDGVVVTPDKTSPALTIGTFNKTKGVEKRAALADLGQWTVEGLHRTCQTYTISTCTYNFVINTNDGAETTNCYLDIEGPPTQSFYTMACQKQPNWLISWGYNAEYGFAVMTVLSQPKQQDAWFGFNDINSVEDFPDVGPNPVYALYPAAAPAL